MNKRTTPRFLCRSDWRVPDMAPRFSTGPLFLYLAKSGLMSNSGRFFFVWRRRIQKHLQARCRVLLSFPICHLWVKFHLVTG